VSDPYIGEIKMFAGNFAPYGWALCNGQLLPIAQYQALYNLIGTTYGGDGQSTFALPNLQGRLPVHQGTGFVMGQVGGSETVTLTAAQLPAHPHSFQASLNTGSQKNPATNVPAAIGAGSAYAQDPPTSAMAPQSIGTDGGGRPHDNMQPYLCVTFIIALTGIYPSQS
jgi:microcystin-dependent protein